jgi:hypothetical protein
MERYATRIYGTGDCVIDGCSDDVVCFEVYIRHRREPLYEVHRDICAKHAVSEGFRIGFDCDHDTPEYASTLDADSVLDSAVLADLMRSYQ